MAKKRTELVGTVVGYSIPHVPSREHDIPSQDPQAKLKLFLARKLGSTLQIQIGDEKPVSVTSRSTEKQLEEKEEITNEMRMEIYNTLSERYPIGSECLIIRRVSTKTDRGTNKPRKFIRYELREND